MLRFAGNWMVFILSLAVLTGCSPSYMPMGDQKVFVDFYLPARGGSVMSQAMLCTPDEAFCGRREEEGYDPDEFFYFTPYARQLGYDNFPMAWIQAKGERPGMVAGLYKKDDLTPDAGDTVGIRLNDLDYAAVTLPPNLEIVEPSFASEHSLSLESELRVTWEPSNQAYPVLWDIFPVDTGPEVLPCDMLSWGTMVGESEDVGTVDIPLEGIPMDLPAEGCDVVVVVRRRNEGVLPSLIASGYIRGEAMDGVIVHLVP